MNNYQEKRIKEAMNNKKFLNNFESGFIDSISSRPEGYQLSAKENKILNRISEKFSRLRYGVK